MLHSAIITTFAPSLSSNTLLFNLNTHSSRTICLQRGSLFSKFKINSSQNQVNTEIDRSQWIIVYKFPYIVPARIFSRVKFYLTAINLLIFLNGIVLFFQGSIPFNNLLIIMGISTFSTALMYIFGQVFRRLIGSIYISSNHKFVRLSHLTFFGNRQESVVPIDLIYPLIETNPNIDDIFLRVSGENSTQLKNSLFLTLKYGGILDEEKFEQIFGPL